MLVSTISKKSRDWKTALWIGIPMVIFLPFMAFFLLLVIIFSGPGSASSLRNGEIASSVLCQAKENVTSSFLDEKLRGRGIFEGKGAIFLRASEKYKVDPILVIGIALHETGNGTSKAVKSRNNPGGLMGSVGLMSFQNLDEGIDRMTENLHKLYISQGLVTVETIQRKYAPVGASNDPINLNSYWATGVKKYVTELGGMTYACRPSSNEITALPRGKFKQPLVNIKITSPFDPNRFHPILHVYRPHNGVDLAQSMGTAVYAASAGTVRFSGMMEGYGNIVIIDHGNGLSTRYGHLSDRSVKQRRQVKEGQLIGKVGSTGMSTGPHLHFEVRINEKAVDPMPYIRR